MKEGLTKLLLISIALVVMVTPVTSCVHRAGFSQLEQTSESRTGAIESLQLFRISGEESSSDWIIEREQTLSITGFVSRPGHAEYFGGDFRQFLMFVPERVGGVNVYHVLYFFETDQTLHESIDPLQDEFDFGSQFIADSVFGETSRNRPLEPNMYFLTQIDFSIHDGWIHADRVIEFDGLFYRSPNLVSSIRRDVFPGVSTMQRDFGNVNTECDFWLDISEGENIRINGFSLGEAAAMKFVRVPARLGDAVIYHYVRVHDLPEIQTSPRQISIQVSLRSGRLMYVDE